MSISPLNGGTIIQFPRTHVMSMPLNQTSTVTIDPTTAAAHAAVQAQQRLAVTDSTIAKRNATNAQKRANHNAIERARRESLNFKFQELARSIPSLSQVRRPSKSVIVQKSLDYINSFKRRTESRDREIRSIKNENVSLREEISRLRQSLGMAPLPEKPASASPEPEESVKTEGLDATHTTPYDSSSSLRNNSSSSSLGDLKHERDNEKEKKNVVNETKVEKQLVEPKSEEGLHMTTSGYVATGSSGAQPIDPTTAAQMHGFLDYMHTDLGGGLGGLAADFVTSSIGFPGVTQAAQVAASMGMYNSPISLAASPNQQIFMPTPCEDVFSINELAMNGCIDQHTGVGVATTSCMQTIEPQQIQTSLQH